MKNKKIGIAIAAIVILALGITNIVTASSKSKLENKFTIYKSLTESQLTAQKDTIALQMATIATQRTQHEQDSSAIYDMRMDYKLVGALTAEYTIKINTIVSKHLGK